MNPNEQQVYAKYPELLRELVGRAMDLARFPIDDMIAVNQRMTLGGYYLRADGTRVDLPGQMLANDAELLSLLQGFKVRLAELMRQHITRGTGESALP